MILILRRGKSEQSPHIFLCRGMEKGWIKHGISLLGIVEIEAVGLLQGTPSGQASRGTGS